MYSKIISFILFVFIASSKQLRLGSHLDNLTCYGIIFDAGSSGTRVYVYSWPCREKTITPLIKLGQKAPDQKKNPGISTLGTNPSGVADYLDPLLKFAKDNVPKEMWKYTPIFLGATAGMRLLPTDQQVAVMDEVRKYLKKSPFLFHNDKWARIISGRDEGSYLWLSANYILGTFTQDNIENGQFKKSYPTVDLGGASTQLAKALKRTKDYPKDDVYGTKFQENSYDVSIDLYAHSWLGYGQDQAKIGVDQQISDNIRKKHKSFDSPCYNNGYKGKLGNKDVYGTGDPELCLEEIADFLDNFKDDCDYDVCSIQGVEQPVISKKEVVYAAGALAFLAKQANLGPVFTTAQMRKYYVDYCNVPFNQTLADKDLYYSSRCFSGLYGAALLEIGYNIPKDTKILTGSIKGLEPTWTLAAIFDQLNHVKGCPDSPVCTFNNLIMQLREDRENPDYQEQYQKEQ